MPDGARQEVAPLHIAVRIDDDGTGHPLDRRIVDGTDQ
jgi:hypothetical protein